MELVIGRITNMAAGYAAYNRAERALRQSHCLLPPTPELSWLAPPLGGAPMPLLGSPAGVVRVGVTPPPRLPVVELLSQPHKNAETSAIDINHFMFVLLKCEPLRYCSW